MSRAVPLLQDATTVGPPSAGSADRHCRRVPNAFSLIELLVAVGIIAILIALLVPSLTNARMQAQSVKCLSNFRSLAGSSLVYAAEDRGEQIVPVHSRIVGFRVWGSATHWGGTLEWGGKSGRGGPYDDPTDPVNTSYFGTRNGFGPATRPLNAVIYKGGFPDHTENPGSNQHNWVADAGLDLGVFRCPGDKGYTGYYHPSWKESALTAFDHFGTSYEVVPLASAQGGNTFCTRSLGPLLHAASRIPSAPNTLLYGDLCGAYAPIAGFFWAGDCTPGPPIGLEYLAMGTPNKGWHAKDWVFNAAYADAHASQTRILEVFAPAPELPYYPGSMLGNHSVGYDYWRCYIVRGPGWQADILPTRPVKWGHLDKGPDECE